MVEQRPTLRKGTDDADDKARAQKNSQVLTRRLFPRHHNSFSLLLNAACSHCPGVWVQSEVYPAFSGLTLYHSLSRRLPDLCMPMPCIN